MSKESDAAAKQDAENKRESAEGKAVLHGGPHDGQVIVDPGEGKVRIFANPDSMHVYRRTNRPNPDGGGSYNYESTEGSNVVPGDNVETDAAEGLRGTYDPEGKLNPANADGNDSDAHDPQKDGPIGFNSAGNPARPGEKDESAKERREQAREDAKASQAGDRAAAQSAKSDEKAENKADKADEKAAKAEAKSDSKASDGRSEPADRTAKAAEKQAAKEATASKR